MRRVTDRWKQDAFWKKLGGGFFFWWKILYRLQVRRPSKFGKLILRKIIKIVATRCHILTLKCTKFDFGYGSGPDPAQRSPVPSSWILRGSILLLEESGGKTGWKSKGERGKGGEGTYF